MQKSGPQQQLALSLLRSPSRTQAARAVASSSLTPANQPNLDSGPTVENHWEDIRHLEAGPAISLWDFRNRGDSQQTLVVSHCSCLLLLLVPMCACRHMSANSLHTLCLFARRHTGKGQAWDLERAGFRSCLFSQVLSGCLESLSYPLKIMHSSVSR